METPQPPQDVGLRNIIDKLAEFVSRNGQEFENITKQKQHGNPKFEFLYGGDYYNYYKYRLAEEQSFLKQQNSQPPQSSPVNQPSIPNLHQLPPITYPIQQSSLNISQPQTQQQSQLWANGIGNMSNGNVNTANITAQIETYNLQQGTLRDQIQQSEQNLTAQHSALVIQQNKQIEEAIEKAQKESLQFLAEENNIDLEEFEAILHPIIDSCTKDSILAGKNWILQHTSDTAKSHVVLQYLLKKALMSGAPFTQKLHLIYLVNDILHHCIRKGADSLKSSLENVVIPMFCSADLIATEDQKSKLEKLLSLWESKAKFFDACVISKLRSPDSSMNEYKTNLVNVHNKIAQQFTKNTQTTFERYQKQHQTYVHHATQQIAAIEQQKQALEQQLLVNVLPMGMMPHMPIHTNSSQINTNQILNNPPPPPLMSQKVLKPIDSPHFSSNSDNNQLQFNNETNPTQLFSPEHNNQPLFGTFNNQQQHVSMTTPPLPPLPPPQTRLNNPNNFPDGINNSFEFQTQNNYPTPGIFPSVATNEDEYGKPPPPNFAIPDLSKPPPGFVGAQVSPVEEKKLIAPYYDLPAGLIVPLIRLEDCSYLPIDPNEIKLPPPVPQSDRLIGALTAFYSLPSHDRPRDNEGWEKLGLYEYYKVKNSAKKQKEEYIKMGLAEKVRSPSPIDIPIIKTKKNNRRCYKSKSRSRSRSKSPTNKLKVVRTQTAERGRGTYSMIPPPKKLITGRNVNNRDNERDRDWDRERNVITKQEKERSISPPSFLNSNYGKSNEFIDESNKGHQMLMKMGWAGTGTGLGPKNQGIGSPISSGEVRDRKDTYKGVGVNLNDPFENFRKNKGAAFIHRMRSRAEEKS